MKITPSDFGDKEVLWTWERMIEKTGELWRGSEETAYLEVGWCDDHSHDLLPAVMDGFAHILWVGR